MSKYRKCGFYWVCSRNTTPQIAYCWGKYWTITGNERAFVESDFEFIDSTSLAFPTYNHMKQFPTSKTMNNGTR